MLPGYWLELRRLSKEIKQHQLPTTMNYTIEQLQKHGGVFGCESKNKNAKCVLNLRRSFVIGLLMLKHQTEKRNCILKPSNNLRI